jgi:hypothetical protein
VIGERILDADGRRWYRVPGGLLAPSVTSVLDVVHKPPLAAWRARHGADADRIAEEAARFGTNVHEGAEALVLGRPLPSTLTVEERAVVDRIAEWLARRQPRDVEAERFIVGWSPAGAYAGTADGVCLRLDGERTVIDWKTGSGPYVTQFSQLAAYARAVDATRALLLFATADGVREEPVDLVKGWRVFAATHRLFVELYEAPCTIELAA